MARHTILTRLRDVFPGRPAQHNGGLKIRTTRNANHLRVHISGALTEKYVPELEKAFNVDAAMRVVLDMSRVTFVDRKSLTFLCRAMSRVEIQNVPPHACRYI